MHDLLAGFVGGEWLDRVDFTTLERASDAHVTDDLRARADDIIWRVRSGNRDMYLLIEFQSRVEHRKRFGELPDCVHGRVRSATPDQIECWSERLLEGASLKELFDLEPTADAAS